MAADRRRSTDPAAVLAALFTGVLFASIPLVRWAQRNLTAHVDSSWILVGVLAFVAAALLWALTTMRRSGRQTSLFDIAWLAAIAAVAGAVAWQLRGRPEEAVHLVQYGILAVLLYRAMRPPKPDVAILVAVVLIGTLVGIVDEIIQWIVPERFWGLNDVAVNAGACALAAAALWRLDPGPWRPIPRSSASLVLRLAAAVLIVLALCLANTPARVARYAARVPGLGILAEADNAMAEYGYRHHLAGIGDMKSRLTMAELAARDQSDAAEVAAALDRYPNDSYQRFLDEHPADDDPFLYEARVHLFSRDSHLRQLREATPGSEAAREHATIAAREQRLIERVFGQTLSRSRFGLGPGQQRTLDELADPEARFVSRSAEHLITSISEPTLRALLLGSAAALLLLDRFVRRRPAAEVTS